MHDFYDDKERNNVLDLTFIGNNNNTDTDNEVYICSDCNIKLIVKADDTKHLGLSYNRLICPKCLLIVDPLKQGDIISDNVKHGEQLHTLTDSNDNTQPHVEVIHSDNINEIENNNEPLYDLEPNELENLKSHGMVIKELSSITKSSVDGRILRQDYDAFEG